MPTALNATTFEELYLIHQKEYNIALMSVALFEPQNIKTYLEKNFEQLPQMFKCIISKDNFDESIKQLDEIFYILDDNEENVRREQLGKGKNEEVIKNQDQIQQVPPKTITLLKGHVHPTAFSQAIIHASPPVSVTKEKRVLLRIESIF